MSEAQKQRPCELLRMLRFDGKSISNVTVYISGPKLNFFLLGILHLKKKQEKHGRKNVLSQDYNVIAENLPKLIMNLGYNIRSILLKKVTRN